MKSRLQFLTSPWFIVSLFLLILNDWYLKSAYPSFLTGKLSDFAGLFAFSWFWISLIPRHKIPTLFLIAISFIWWKSPLSDGFIHFWNDLPLWKVYRVVDFGDCIALVMLPLTVILRKRPNLPGWRGRAAIPVLLIIFAVSSISSNTPLGTWENKWRGKQNRLTKELSYSLDLDWVEAWHLLPRGGLWFVKDIERSRQGAHLKYKLHLSQYFGGIWMFDIKLIPDKKGCKLLLTRLSSESTFPTRKIMAQFEEEVVDELAKCQGKPTVRYYYDEKSWTVEEKFQGSFSYCLGRFVTNMDREEIENGEKSMFSVGLKSRMVAYGTVEKVETSGSYLICVDSLRNICGEDLDREDVGAFNSRVLDPLRDLGFSVKDAERPQ